MNHGRTLILATIAVLAAFLALPASPALGASYLVDTTDDDPGIDKVACSPSADDCSLRGAITKANTASSPGDVITFDETVFNPGTIVIASALPALTDGGDTIDGTGASIVFIQAADARAYNCLVINSAGNTVKGLQLTDCAGGINLQAAADNNTIGPGNVMFDNDIGVIAFSGAEGNTIIGNKIGTDETGAAIAGAANITGVSLSGASNNTIGGTSPGDRNIISGNTTGIDLQGTVATGNKIFGNFIGTDATGIVDLGNSNGILLQSLTNANTIGGTAPGQANLISGNGNNVVLTSSSFGNTIAGNIIGPDVNGSGALLNGEGVTIKAMATMNTIGPRNVISDSSSHGVLIKDSGTTGNVVKGNFIGTNLTGTAAIPNAQDGVQIQSSANDNLIGGTGPGDGNVIAFNGGDGVEVFGAVAPAATGNSIRGNSIHSNTGLPINNTAGGNAELLPPILTSTLFGTVSGFACDCTVDIFSDNSTDARFYEGSVIAVGGIFTFVNGAPFIGANVTATRTDPSGNTSELTTFFPIDSDGDGTDDGMDMDDDNDGIEDLEDPCRVFPEDFDGFQDADGCPDPDNDQDGICDPGQVSVSCTGSDFGKTAFFPSPGDIHDHSDPAPIDCRNIPEDYDGFHDGDGCPEPDNDNDGFPDITDDCPGTDIHAGGDAALGPPQDFNHNGIQDSEAAFTTDDSVLTFEDYDGILDTDGCHDSPGDDFDGDGLSDDDEVFVYGTLPFNPDTDADTVLDGPDNCKLTANPDQINSDGDAFGDACDNCPSVPNAGQGNADGDAWGDACDNCLAVATAWFVPVGDPDCDGFTTTLEDHVGTNPTLACGTNAWPPDIDESGTVSAGDVFTIFDFWLTSVPRYDLDDSGTVSAGDVFLVFDWWLRSCT